MTVIEKAKELGALIQQDERYTAFYDAARANDNDPELQRLIGIFNMKRRTLNEEMRKEDKSAEILTTLDDEIGEVYQQIMANPCMVKYNDTKEAFEKLLAGVNYIITKSANGEDPATLPDEPPVSSCSGSCSTCGGCG
ncbi:MAG: YlbF family regulator [Ruminococcus sp.]|nr:YlbF family regulator [Ruminococcus sp.]